MDSKQSLGLIGMLAGSAIGSLLSFGVYGTLKDRGWNPWAAGAVTGAASAALGGVLLVTAAKLVPSSVTAGMPRSHTAAMSKSLVQTTLGALAPAGVPRLGPMNIGMYSAQPMGGYAMTPVSGYTAQEVGCVGCN